MVKYNKLTHEFLNQCHSEVIAEKSKNFMRYFAVAQYDHVLTKFSVNMLYITIIMIFTNICNNTITRNIAVNIYS